MKTICTFALAASAVVLTACSGGGGYTYASMGVGDAYYDNFYGPFHDGYWGIDGSFYYRDGRRQARFLRDDGHHFRRDAADGFHQVPGRVQGGARLQGRGLHGGAPATSAPANPTQNKPS